jgi:hypothetical protein
MKIIKRTFNGEVAFKSYTGWIIVQEGQALELGDVMRFTEGEAKASNLGVGEEWVHYGCYK